MCLKQWRIRVSILVPLTCKASALPLELIPHMIPHVSKTMENLGIDPGTSHMLSERSTTWANSPYDYTLRIFSNICQYMANMRLAKTQISVGIHQTVKVFCVDKWQRR